MNDKNDHLQDARSSARRRLIRGTFAAPAILALHSGSAFAQSTSATSCLAKQNADPIIPVPLPTDADDTYFRYQLWVIKKGNGNPVSYWVKGADLSIYVRPGYPPFLASGSWWQFNVDKNKLVNGGPTTTEPVPVNQQTFTQTGKWVVLRVNGDGQLVGAGITEDATNRGSPVGDSCWNSFATALLQ